MQSQLRLNKDIGNARLTTKASVLAHYNIFTQGMFTPWLKYTHIARVFVHLTNPYIKGLSRMRVQRLFLYTVCVKNFIHAFPIYTFLRAHRFYNCGISYMAV